MLKIGVCGAAGRMGCMIIKQIAAQPEIRLAAAVEIAGSQKIGIDAGEPAGCGKLGVNISAELSKVISACDVVIDFSSIENTLKSAEICSSSGKGLVIGTTGFNDEQRAKITLLAKKTSIVLSANMSVGVNLLFKLVKEATKVLKDKDFDVEITETHHRFKKDAPSGTAMKLAHVVADEKGLDLKKVMVSGREGMTGERPKDAIGVLAIRAGDVVGDHTVTFGALGERIELTHKAHSRETFAKGAIIAAQFLKGKTHGLYDMQDVLQIK